MLLSRHEIGEMAALLGKELDAMYSKMKPSSAACPDEQVAKVRGRLFDSQDDSGSDGLLQAMHQDPAFVDMRLSACIKSLQRLCWFWIYSLIHARCNFSLASGLSLFYMRARARRVPSWLIAHGDAERCRDMRLCHQ